MDPLRRKRRATRTIGPFLFLAGLTIIAVILIISLGATREAIFFAVFGLVLAVFFVVVAVAVYLTKPLAVFVIPAGAFKDKWWLLKSSCEVGEEKVVIHLDKLSCEDLACLHASLYANWRHVQHSCGENCACEHHHFSRFGCRAERDEFLKDKCLCIRVNKKTREIESIRLHIPYKGDCDCK